MNIRMRFVAVALAGILMPGAAVAHAFLQQADPAVGATVSKAPAAVTLWFSEDLEPAFSRLRVEDAAGKPVESESARADGGVLSLPLPPLSPGRYHVFWRVVSLDAHETEGDFTFTVAP